MSTGFNAGKPPLPKGRGTTAGGGGIRFCRKLLFHRIPICVDTYSNLRLNPLYWTGSPVKEAPHFLDEKKMGEKTRQEGAPFRRVPPLEAPLPPSAQEGDTPLGYLPLVSVYNYRTSTMPSPV